MQIVLLVFIPNIVFVEYISTIILIIILFNSYLFYSKTKSQLDVFDICCPLIENDIDKTVKNLIKANTKLNKNPLYKITTLRKAIINTILSQDNPDQFSKGPVFENHHVFFIYKFQNIYEVIDYNIEKSQYGSYEKGVNCLFNCLEKYFKYVDDYYVHIDMFYNDFFINSEKIIVKLQKSNLNQIYYDYFLIKLIDLYQILQKYNVNHDYYFDFMIKFFFEKIVANTKCLFDDFNKFNKLLNIFQLDSVYVNTANTYILYIRKIKETVYIKNKNLEKSMINYSINIFTYYILSNKKYLMACSDLVESVLDLQNSLDAQNLLVPMIAFDDYTTNFGDKYDDDKTLSRICFNLLLKQENDERDVKINLVRIDIISKLIDILIVRYSKGGIHIAGVFEQLYKIFFDIFIFIDGDAFKRFFTVNCSWDFKKVEENQYLSCLNKILNFHLSLLKNNSMIMDIDEAVYSEIKMFLVLISKKSLDINKYIGTYKRIFVTNIMFNRQVDTDIKSYIYSLFRIFLPDDYKNHFEKMITRIHDNTDYGFYNQRYSLECFHLIMIDFYQFRMHNIVEYVNSETIKT